MDQTVMGWALGLRMEGSEEGESAGRRNVIYHADDGGIRKHIKGPT